VVSCVQNKDFVIQEIQFNYLSKCADCDLLDVVEVIDGDTIITPIGKVRFYGVNTPEKGEKCFDLAKSETTRLANHRIKVEYGPRKTDRYGRLLAYVYTENGDSIDEFLISNGLGKAWTKDGQHKEYLMNLEKNSKNKKCLW